MKAEMATKRNPPGWKFGERCTEFQLHKSQLSAVELKSIIDYTEKRLQAFIDNAVDNQQRDTLLQVLDNYRKGNIAVAWKAGKPVWTQIVKA